MVAGSGAVIPYPHIDASFRFGVGEGVDLGVRAGWSFLEAQGKFLVTRPGAPGVIVSIAPTFGGIFLGAGGAGAGLLNFALPALIGIPVGEHEFVIGPRLQGYYLFAGAGTGSAGAFILAPGGTLGFAFQVAESVALMPELGVAVPVFGAAGVSGGVGGATGFAAGGAFVQFKLGILIGKKRKVQVDDDMTPPPPPPPSGSEPPPLPVR